jgi:hypothetical protein
VSFWKRYLKLKEREIYTMSQQSDAINALTSAVAALVVEVGKIVAAHSDPAPDPAIAAATEAVTKATADLAGAVPTP